MSDSFISTPAIDRIVAAHTLVPHQSAERLPVSEVKSSTLALVGRNLILREMTKGTICPLYLARDQRNTQATVGAIDKLVRVIPLPEDLPQREHQRIVEAVWNSANVAQDWSIQISDIVTNKNSIALVHDLIAGNLLRTMHRSALGAGRPLPESIAVRIALDLLEGVRQSREYYRANGYDFHAGSISMGSLYLCSDGKTRALDGQVMAAVLRSARLRAYWRDAFAIAPELLDDTRKPDERTDVYAIGKVLSELLAGRQPDTDEVTAVTSRQRVASTKMRAPQRLTHLLERALEVEPSKRYATIREMVIELVMCAETVASHTETAAFAADFSPVESTQGGAREIRGINERCFADAAEKRSGDSTTPRTSGIQLTQYAINSGHARATFSRDEVTPLAIPARRTSLPVSTFVATTPTKSRYSSTLEPAPTPTRKFSAASNHQIDVLGTGVRRNAFVGATSVQRIPTTPSAASQVRGQSMPSTTDGSRPDFSETEQRRNSLMKRATVALGAATNLLTVTVTSLLTQLRPTHATTARPITRK